MLGHSRETQADESTETGQRLRWKPHMEATGGTGWNGWVYLRGVFRSALQQGLGSIPGLAAPSEAHGDAPGAAAPEPALLRPPSHHCTFCLVGALRTSLSNPLLGLQWHQKALL